MRGITPAPLRMRPHVFFAAVVLTRTETAPLILVGSWTLLRLLVFPVSDPRHYVFSQAVILLVALVLLASRTHSNQTGKTQAKQHPRPDILGQQSAQLT